MKRISEVLLLPAIVASSVGIGALWGVTVGVLAGWALLFLLAALSESLVILLARMNWRGYRYPRSYTALGTTVVSRSQADDKRQIRVWLIYAAACVAVAVAITTKGG